ncbi:MAG: PAS domain S-box protein, partial [Luteibacter sp.]
MSDDEGMYRTLVEGITDYALFRIAPDGRIAVWNRGARLITGYTMEDVAGLGLATLFDASEQAEGLPARLLEQARRDGCVEEEGWRVRQDGTRFWARLVIDALYDEERFVGYGGVMRDRTERKRVDEELWRSQEQFRVLVQGVADYAIYLLDPQGRVTNWNSGAARIKGYAPDEIVGEHYSRFYSPEDVERREPWTNLEAAAREGRLETEGWRVRKDGTRFWAHVVIDRISDDAGALVGFAKVTRDVTDRRAASLALQEAREALFQSQKLEAIGQLTGGVAHDFNNLLMAIQSNLELLGQGSLQPERVQRLLANASSGVRRGVSLTRRMLAFARRQELDLEAVDPIQLVTGMSDLLRTSLGPSIAIDVRFPLSLPPVRVDLNQMELCLLNLCVNARDAMPDGGTITITGGEVMLDKTVSANLPAGRFVRLCISDTGTGMDEATLARATEPFFTTKGIGKGTGLGLSMVHGIVEQSGGALRLRSRQPGGTTVEILLPTADPAAAVAAESVASTPAAAEAERAPSVSVLVVDDDTLVLATTVEMLTYDGFQTYGATSADLAMQQLAKTPEISVVVTDHAMPGTTGAELAAQLQRSHPHVRVVLASGYAELPGLP